MRRIGWWMIPGLLLTMGSAPAATAADADAPLTVVAVPWGPSQETAEAARNGVLSNLAVKRLTSKAEVSVVGFEILEPPRKAPGPAVPPDRYKAYLFDYTHNKAYVVEALFGSSRLGITETDVQPEPDDAERARAIAIIDKDPVLGPALRDGQLAPYPPMPPLVNDDLPVGAANRTVAIGLSPKNPSASQEIVGVDMIRRVVVRYKDRAPAASRATVAACGPANAGQSTSSQGLAGQVQITISKGTDQIWSFLAVRPSASSGTRGSGVELRDIFYKGKKVLARAHAPILNVHYNGDSCGPYRDWQYQEGMFVAQGRDVIPGVRAARSAPETMLDDGTDSGNFKGLAYFVSGNSVTLASEMEAGWYRYVSYWIFDENGTIHPRFGFDGVSNSCICIIHHHNVYWRFDFDIVTPQNNQIYQVNAGTPTLQTAEAKQLRAAGRTWKVQNSASGEAYSIVPGAHDGVADSSARGDVWMLLFKSNAELDDGVNITTGQNTFIMIDNFIGEQLTAASNVVFWYGAHFDHDINAPEDHDFLGPDLVPVNW